MNTNQQQEIDRYFEFVKKLVFETGEVRNILNNFTCI